LTEKSISTLTASGAEAAKVETLKAMENLPFRNREEMLAQAKTLLGETDFAKMKDDLVRNAAHIDGGSQLERIEMGYYALLTFGALIFIIASAFLPQLTRLKLAGLELEKSTTERVETVRSIGIDK
jgi:hypothetical protein